MSAITLTAEQINGWVAQVIWPLFRVAGLLSVMPVFGGTQVPVRVRVALSLLITILIVPSLTPVPELDPLSFDSLLITLQQLLIGAAMGLLIIMVFNAVTMAGESIAMTMGLGFALMNDPQNGAQVPVVSQFYLVLATLLFLSFDGHHAVLLLLYDSFEMMPVGESLGADSYWLFARWAANIFYGALAIALPALAAMLTTNFAMGIITRAAPQLNIFSVGFPITMTVGFFAIMLTLPTFQFSFSNLLDLVYIAIAEMLQS